MAKLVIGTSNQAVIPSVIKEVEVPMPTGKYSLFDRVVDDSNNSIGTVAGFYTDANNVEYAIVYLDGTYRRTDLAMSTGRINYPSITELNYVTVTNDLLTAKQTCDADLSDATSAGFTSPAIEYCRTLSFVIGGVAYVAQVPTWRQMSFGYLYNSRIDALDPTQTLGLLDRRWVTSTPYFSGNSYKGYATCYVSVLRTMYYICEGQNRQTAIPLCPILEIPNAL